MKDNKKLVSMQDLVEFSKTLGYNPKTAKHILQLDGVHPADGVQVSFRMEMFTTERRQDKGYYYTEITSQIMSRFMSLHDVEEIILIGKM